VTHVFELVIRDLTLARCVLLSGARCNERYLG
jgi:hypothetical protein